MHYSKLFKNQQGTSLVETVIGVSVIVLVMQFYGMAMVNMKKVNKQAALIAAKEEMATDIVNDISNYTKCDDLIMSALGASATTDVKDSFPLAGGSGDITVAPFVEKFLDSEVVLTRVNLKYTRDPADLKDKSSTVSYTGEMIFYFNRGDTTRTGQNSKNYLNMRPITVPFKLFSENLMSSGTGIKWGQITCTTATSAVNAEVAEICALYGGSMTDGLHCGFNRFQRLHSAKPSSQVVPIDILTARAQRLTLSDALCYVDTLNAMAPDENFVSVLPDRSRDYTKDYYKKNYVTRFCKSPTGVRKGAPLPFDNLDVLTSSDPNVRLSTDVAELIKEDPAEINCPYRYYHLAGKRRRRYVYAVSCQSECHPFWRYREPGTRAMVCRYPAAVQWPFPL